MGFSNREIGERLEDCRDFLRTGRCKYGVSCKYNHPSNVQSGGGMRAPLDPSEPLFPIRPHEPPCQYYMKHGTCKFAQACKFHHPPQVSQRQLANEGSVVVMKVGRHESPQPMVLNPMSAREPSAAAPMMVQFLPQRPDEPDCIYFLKNGRCKYGATCRFHHPLNYHQRRAEEQRRHHEQQRKLLPVQERYARHVQYVAQPVSTVASGGIFLSEGVPLSNLDREGKQNYHAYSVVSGDGTSSYCVPTVSGGTVGTTDVGSSASSITSSFDASASVADQEGTLAWNRHSGSVSSLNNDNRQHQQRHVIPHSASDGNIARRFRSSSHGSAHDIPLTEHTSPMLVRDVSSGSWVATRTDRGHPYEQTQSFRSRKERGESQSGDARPGSRAAMKTRRRSQKTRPGDEGFTMMTSALLTMLDTPEEALAEQLSEEEPPAMPTVESSQTYGPQSHGHHPPPGYHSHQVDPAMFKRLTLADNPHQRDSKTSTEYDEPSWSPWSGSNRGFIDGNHANSLPISTRQQSAAHEADVGLYLP